MRGSSVNTRDLRMFLVAARVGSFRAAADELGVDRSAISKGVARLEARVGVRLFHRNTRVVTLTPAGSRLARGAREPLHALGRVLDDLDDAPLRGEVRLAAPLAFGLTYVAPAVHTFLVDHPEIELEVHYDEYSHNLIEAGVDLAVRGGLLDDSELVARRLFPMTVGLYGRSDLLPAPLAHPRELLDLPVLLHRRSPLVFHRGGDEATIRPTPRMLTRSTSARLMAARAGVGIAILPDFVQHDLRPALPEWQLGSAMGIYLLRPDGEPSPAARALWDHLIQALTPEAVLSRRAPG